MTVNLHILNNLCFMYIDFEVILEEHTAFIFRVELCRLGNWLVARKAAMRPRGGAKERSLIWAIGTGG
jgi:hypothetical protein